MGSSCWRQSISQLFSAGWSLQSEGKRVTLRSLLWQLITGLVEVFVGFGDAPDFKRGKLCLTCTQSFRVLDCGPIKVHMIHIGTAWMHTELPEQCQLSSLSMRSSSTAIVSRRNWLQLFWWIFSREDCILSACYLEPYSKTSLGCSVWSEMS